MLRSNIHTAEFCFRGVLVALLQQKGWSRRRTVLLCPLFFGVAHVHHCWDLVVVRKLPVPVALGSVGLQLAYSTLFGAFATMLLVQTGSLAAPVAAHVFCNACGLPPIASVWRHSRTLRLILLGGIAAFAYATVSLWARPPQLPR